MVYLKSCKWHGFILNRFHNFDDALVRGVHLIIGPTRTNRRATVVLEARDVEAEGDEGWSKVVLRLNGLTEYRLVENDFENYHVLSLGLKIQEFGGVVFFDLAPDTDEPDRPEDFRRSPFYLAASNYSWGLDDYPKGWTCRDDKTSGLSNS